MARNNGIPTADEEALQQPTIDPIMLLASMGTGGGIGYSAGSNALREDLPGLLEYIASKGQSPQSYLGRLPFIKEGLKSAAESGGNFLSSALINNAISGGKHPILSNYAAMPVIPNELLDLLPEATQITQEGGAFASQYPQLAKLLQGFGVGAMVPSLLRDKKK